jgi:hypothetical protein
MKHIAILFLTIGLGGMSVYGQNPDFTFYEVEVAFDRAQLKEVMLAVAALDPDGAVFHSDDMAILQVKVGATITDHELRSAITAAGVALLPGTPDLQARYSTPPTVPMYVPTGDPKGDHARYEAEVHEWNKLNPGQQMPAPIPFTDEE